MVVHVIVKQMELESVWQYTKKINVDPLNKNSGSNNRDAEKLKK